VDDVKGGSSLASVLERLTGDEEAFVSDRTRFALDGVRGTHTVDGAPF